jgi:quinol monooxygenase YgiN
MPHLRRSPAGFGVFSLKDRVMDTIHAHGTDAALRYGIYVDLYAKPGREEELIAFLQSALPIVLGEERTINWYALRLGDSHFAIFDTFRDEEGRETHLAGQVAQALAERAPDLLASQPVIHKTEILASK